MGRMGTTIAHRNTCLWLTAIWLGVTTSLSAQVFAGGGVAVSWQPDISVYVGTQNPSVPENGIHGTSAAGTATLGVFPSRHVGVAVELAIPQRFTADQVADKYRTHNAHADMIVSGLLHLRAGPRFLDVVAGVSFVREQTDQQIAPRLFAVPGMPYAPYNTSPESIRRNTFGITGGLDVPVTLGSHAAIVPQFRLHWIARENDDTAASPRFLGLSPLVFQPGIGVRVTF